MMQLCRIGKEMLFAGWDCKKSGLQGPTAVYKALLRPTAGDQGKASRDRRWSEDLSGLIDDGGEFPPSACLPFGYVLYFFLTHF